MSLAPASDLATDKTVRLAGRHIVLSFCIALATLDGRQISRNPHDSISPSVIGIPISTLEGVGDTNNAPAYLQIIVA